MDASKKAKLFSFLGIGLGTALILIYIVFWVIIGGLSAINNS